MPLVVGQGPQAQWHSRALRKLFKELYWQVQDGETAGWWPGRMHIRPFDVLALPKNLSQWLGLDVGVSDPTRIGALPASVSYNRKGASARRMAARKSGDYRQVVRDHGQPSLTVRFEPFIMEVYGGFSFGAIELWKEWIKYASAEGIGINYRSDQQQLVHGSHESTWSALSFSPYHAQNLSWQVVYSTAIGAFNGVQAAAAAQAAR